MYFIINYDFINEPLALIWATLFHVLTLIG